MPRHDPPVPPPLHACVHAAFNGYVVTDHLGVIFEITPASARVSDVSVALSAARRACQLADEASFLLAKTLATRNA